MLLSAFLFLLLLYSVHTIQYFTYSSIKFLICTDKSPKRHHSVIINSEFEKYTLGLKMFNMSENIRIRLCADTSVTDYLVK